jgi:malate dehydrogenase
MTIVTADDIRQATGSFILGPKDRLTPLARDVAAELGIKLEVRDAPTYSAVPNLTEVPGRSPSAALDTSATKQRPAVRAPAGLELPPSGAMYRRGAPLAAGVSAPRVEGGVSPSATAGGRVPVGVVGAGHVGAMTALRLAESNLFDRITLVDVVPGLAAGLALDMWHGAGLCGFDTRLVGVEDMAGLRDARYIVVTAGRPRQPGMSRTDLTAVNAEIITSVAVGIRQHAPDATVIVVTNPLEEMTHVMQCVTGFPHERVIGMAGVLDSARFCSLVGLTGKATPADVRAFAFGSHGPEMVIPMSQAFVAGSPIEQVLDAATLTGIVERTRDSGAEIVALLQKGSAYFSPAESAAAMVRAMERDSTEVMTACVQSQGAYGLVDTRVGLPVRLGPAGVKEIVAMTLRPDELSALRSSADRIAARIQELG